MRICRNTCKFTNYMYKKIFQLLLLLIVSSAVNAQQVVVHLQGSIQDIDVFTEEKYTAHNFANEIDANTFLQDQLNKLRSKGYLAASIDSIDTQANTITAALHIGKQYKWATIDMDQVAPVMLNNIGYNEKTFTNQPIEDKQIAILCEKLLRYCENNGYPFANIYLDSFVEKTNGLNAKLIVEKNYLIKIDSIDVQGDVEISTGYLYQYLGIHPGDEYNESVVKNISNRIRELPFMQEEKAWRMSFSITQNILTLYLKNKDANRADVLVGLLPNNNALGGKFLLTGDVKLALVNSLRGGESISLNWQNLQYKSPRLIIETSAPYLFGTAIGATAKFHYTKNDSSFRNVIGEAGLQYMASHNRFFKVYFNTNSSDIITVDTFIIKSTKAFPSNVDVKTKSFGAEWFWNATDYKWNPRKGFTFILNGNAGIRNIIKNNIIENLYDASSSRTFAYLYDSIALRSYKYTSTLVGNYYYPLAKRITAKIGYSGGILYNLTLFRNELFQIGGYRLMRGFDEASLFVNQYHVATIEPRYILAQNSYLFGFTDIGWVQSPYLANKKIKQALGVGAGITLQTRNGLFNFMYALGNNLGSGIQFKNSKIHFGYVNTF